MKITIKCKPKEIADLALELQSRQKSKSGHNTSEYRNALEKQIALIENASQLSAKAHRYDELTQLTGSLISLYLALHSKQD